MAAEIKISGNLLLRADGFQWSLFETSTFQTGKRAGEHREVGLGHYTNLTSALEKILDYKLRMSDATTIQELAENIREFRAELESILTLQGGR